MKKILLAASFICPYFSSLAQHTEISAGLNGSVLSFRGESVVNSSFVIFTNAGGGHYTNDLYSKKSGIGIGVDLAVLRVTKKKMIYGVTVGMELLKHNIPIDFVSYPMASYPATGEIYIHSHFINVRPSAGYRFRTSTKTTLDIAASAEIAIGLASLYEIGTATRSDNGETIRVENDRDEIPTDIRTGLQAKLNVKRYSLLAGYWLGLTNYYSGYSGLAPKAYTKIFRLGLSYRLNKGK